MSATPTFGRYAGLPVDEMTFVVTSRWHSAYPTAAHEKRGKEVGLPAPLVEAIIAGLPASFSDPREQLVYEVARPGPLRSRILWRIIVEGDRPRFI